MTESRRVVLVLAALALAGMALYPPWVYTDGSFAGYSWIWTGLDAAGQTPRPELARFAFQCVALVGVARAAYFAIPDKSR